LRGRFKPLFSQRRSRLNRRDDPRGRWPPRFCFVAAFTLLKGYSPHHHHLGGPSHDLTIKASASRQAATRRYAHLPGQAAPLVRHQPCWTAPNATTLLFSRCHRYSPATTSFITAGSRNRCRAETRPTTLMPAHSHLVGEPHTHALLLPSFPDQLATGTGTPPLISRPRPFYCRRTEVRRVFSERDRYLPDRVQELPPDLI